MSTAAIPFAEQLKKEMLRLNVNLPQTAAILDISITALERWEKGTATPPAITQEGALARLAKATPSITPLEKRSHKVRV